MVRFLNTVSWAGLYFCHAPGQVIDVDNAVAAAREQAGLGKIVVDKTLPAAAVRNPRPAKPVKPTEAE